MHNEVGTIQTSSPQGKRILVLSPFEGFPLLHGSIVRTYFLIRYLASMNQVWFVCRPKKPEGLEHVILNHPHRLGQLLNFNLLWQVRNQILTEDINLIIVSHFWSGLWGVVLKWLTGKPLLYDAHNVEYVRLRRQKSWLWPLIWICEWVLCRASGLILTVSEFDKASMANKLHVSPTKIQVIENGADIASLQMVKTDRKQRLQELDVGSIDPIVLFFGTLSHRPNRDAIQIIVDHLAPQVKATFIIAGKGSEDLATRFDQIPNNVVLAGFVDDIVGLIKSANVVVAPLCAGSGTRFKIIESIACGRPVVSTTIGAEGIDRKACGSALIISDSWNEFVEQINQAIQMTAPIPLKSEFVAKYDWESILERIDFSPILS